MPSWKRYKDLFSKEWGKFSILRNLEYEQIKERTLKGKILDFGGGGEASYHNIVSFEDYESVNINETIKPTWLTKIGETLPCPKDHYDGVLTLNTIEHIHDASFVLQEMYKVLKKDGNFTCAVPFLFPIHAYPHDFFRPTDRWWEETLKDIGFKDIEITPLLWGPFSTGLVCSGTPGPLKLLRIHFSLLLDLVYMRLGQRFNISFLNDLPFHSLGFFIEAKKA